MVNKKYLAILVVVIVISIILAVNAVLSSPTNGKQTDSLGNSTSNETCCNTNLVNTTNKTDSTSVTTTLPAKSMVKDVKCKICGMENCKMNHTLSNNSNKDKCEVCSMLNCKMHNNTVAK